MTESIIKYIPQLVADYATAAHRILFIDYDGTLAPFKFRPDDAAPTLEIIEILKSLSSDRSNHVVIISGRDRRTLEHWLGNLPLILVAEHGGFYKDLGGPWQSFFPNNPGWKNIVLPALYALEFQYEGSFVEEKHYSIAWHYRAVANKINEDERKHILSAFESINSNDFWIYHEDCTLEFRTAGIDKGEFANLYKWNKQHFDFVLAIGDGRTDEDLFNAIGKDHYTIKVGHSLISSARFFVRGQEDVIPLMKNIASARKFVNIR
jgi:trehalose 6-phosphate synthase/phosphatase